MGLNFPVGKVLGSCGIEHTFKKKGFHLFLDGKEGRERNVNVVASAAPPTGDLARNPGMCPDSESTGDPSVRRPVLNPLSHTSQG